MSRTKMALAAIAAAATVAGLVAAPAAEAVENPPSATVDVLYPLKEIVMLLTGPDADLRTPGMVDHLIKAGLLAAPGRIGEPLKALLDPDLYRGPDAREKVRATVQRIWDALTHLAPFGLGLPSDPRYLPDWDGDGRWGEAQDHELDRDYTADAPETARFRYPCVRPDGDVWYQTTAGTCKPWGTWFVTFKMGTAHKFRVVDSRGMSMAAKMLTPADFAGSGRKYPVTVMSNGASERQSDLYMYSQTAVRDGFVGITYDQAGQGASEGGALDLVLPLQNVKHCFAPGACRDLQDLTRWLAGQDITPVVDLNDEDANVAKGFPKRDKRRDPAYAPAGENVRNPWADRLDLGNVSLWGQSMGSIATTNYLWYQGNEGGGIDGRPLPRAKSAIGLSGFAPSTADAPIQVQTADFDIPGVTAQGFSGPNPIFEATDGPVGTKAWYDDIRKTGKGGGAMQTITYEGGSHGDSINWAFVPRGVWSPHISVTYAVNWLKCYGRGTPDGAACTDLREPMHHLSRAVASEYDPDGPAGPSPSLCVTVPDRATVEQLLWQPEVFWKQLFGHPQHDCA